MVVNKWWPIGSGIACLLLYIIGGALIGAFSSSCYAYDTDYSYGYTCNIGLWQGGVGLLSLASIMFFVWLVLIIVWAVQRNRNAGASQVIVNNHNNAYGSSDPSTYPNAVPLYKTNATVTENGYEKPNGGSRFCGQCGNTVTSSFCPRCGASVPGV